MQHMVRGFVCLAFAAGVSFAASAALPEGYTRLQYIQSNRSGSTRIVTNYTPQPNNDIIEAVFEPVVTNVTQAIWCARGKSATTSTFSLFLIGDKFRYDYGDGTTATGTPFGTAEPGAVYTVVVSNNVIMVNGVVGQTFEPVTYTAGNPLMLFGRYHNVTSQNLGDYADIKLYSFKVWRKGELIHNFIPCTDANGAATLYDVGTSPCTFSKTGTFTAGPEAVSAFEVEAISDQFRISDVVTPEPVVKDSTTHETLVKDRDYTLVYANNDAAGTGIITITGKDGSAYAGKSETVYFNIYQRIASIISNGSQCINTGIVPGPTTAVEMRFKTGSYVHGSAFFGAGGWNAQKTYVFCQRDDFYYFDGAPTVLGKCRCETGVDASIFISTNAADNCVFNLADCTATTTVSLAYTGTDPLYIFGTNKGNNRTSFTLYSFRMWKDGELVRDYIPVCGGATVGLFDFVTAKLYTGSGAFAAGPDLTDLVVAKIPNQFYAGAALEPSVVVSNFAGTALLERGVDYTVAYEGNAAVGTGKAIVTGVGAYRGVVEREFAIYPAAPAPAMGVDAYIQHGLIHHWDGYDNAGTGAFDPAARVWKDLKGGLDFTLNDHAQWGEGFLEADGYCAAAAGKTGKYLTLEFKHCSSKRRRGMPFVSGCGWNRVTWYSNQTDLWFHHFDNKYRNTLTGLTVPDTNALSIAVVYGAASGENDAPMLFYQDGRRRTSGISNQKTQARTDWITSFGNATLGGVAEARHEFEGRIHSIRLYDCRLTEREVAYNAAVDRVRYDGVAPAEAFNAYDMRWNATSGKVEVLVDFTTFRGEGTFSVNGGGASAWVNIGDELTVVYTPAPGERATEWTGLPRNAARSADFFTVVFTAEAPITATLTMRKKVDPSRALNADPGCEEGAGYFNSDGKNRTFMPVSWQRTEDRANLGSHGTTSDERGCHFIRPYQGKVFSQPGLALPAGEYTLTLDHLPDTTEDTIHAWQIVDTNNNAKTICTVTNDFYTYGTSWHTVQAGFTIDEDGIYTLKVVKTADGSTSNSYMGFDNISITSDTDLHIEVEKCYPYLGEEQVRPPVVVRDDAGNVLTEGEDYELLYGANNFVGSGLDDSTVAHKHGNGYVAARGLGTHYGVAGANFRLGRPIYVKPDGLSTNGGTSWEDAVDFATALSLAAAVHANSEIWIAGSNVLTSAATTQTFYGNKIFRGGFKGTEATIEEREDGAYSFVDGDGQFSAVVFRDCAYVHFERLVFRGSPSRAVSKTSYTGSVYIDDCVFEENGNAVFTSGLSKSPYSQGELSVKNSVFRNNFSTDAADGAAAIHGYLLRRVSAENTLFVSNTLATSSKVKTSAIFANTAAVELKECDFIGNVGESATYGTVRASGSDATDRIANCLFLGNQTDGANAAAVTVSHPSLAGVSEVVNCTFAANANSVAGGCAGVKGTKGKVNVRNSIFRGNGVDFADHANCPFDVDYTLLADDTGATYSFVNGESKVGEAMVYGDPLFAAADDCHVLSEAGYFDATGGIHYAAEDVRSPAIDAGDPESAYSRETAPNGDCINLGRYGNTEQASRTPEAVPEVDGPPQIEWNDPDGYSRPTVSFTMGGAGTYVAQAIIYISTDGGETWENVSGTLGGLVKGATREFVVPGYYEPGETIQVKVAVSGAGHDSVSEVAEDTVQGKLPPWHGKKGPENVIHVRPGAIGKGDGTSWSDAFPTWEAALDELSSLKNEIWIAGTHVMSGTAKTRSMGFAATIRGGFRGWEESAEERPEGLRSVLDGKDAFDILLVNNSASLLIDGIEFVRGINRGFRKAASSGDITITNCVFYGNSQGGGNWECQGNVNNNYQYGGGGLSLYGSGSAKAVVAGCTFEANISSGSGNCGFGGGAYIGGFGGGAEVLNCHFTTNYMKQNFNSSAGCMAALHVYNTRATVEGCDFRGHRANGTVDFRGSCAGSVFRNCIFSGNYAGGQGVVQVNLDNATDAARIENCTFAYNIDAPALKCTKGAVAVTNCIFYGNLCGTGATAAADLRVAADATATVGHSLFAVEEADGSTVCVSAATPGTLDVGAGCVYGDPLFVTPVTNLLALTGSDLAAQPPRTLPSKWTTPSYAALISFNLHLRGGSGYVDEATGEKVTAYRRKGNSPAIDAGDKSVKCLEPHPCGWRVNMGAYGNTPWATMSKGGTALIVR